MMSCSLAPSISRQHSGHAASSSSRAAPAPRLAVRKTWETQLPLRQQRRQPAALAALPPQLAAQLAEAVDTAPEWTLDQIVGLVFAALLLALYLSSKQVDAFVARAQRRQLGLCEACGGLYEAATCSQAGCPQRRGGAATGGGAQ